MYVGWLHEVLHLHAFSWNILLYHVEPILFKRPSLMLVFALTIIMISAQFTAYSYIEPFSLNIAHFSSAQTTTLLLIYGAAGFLGSYLFGKFGAYNVC